ncbi:spermidine synthase [Microbulbifer sediminum]|uniref:spermidine synthase n=1 Tax=Microbulbifer sediminum TaxID=2904250 RepID=UPI001F43757A|nr:methyltransferase domain-containing protein [Microbulbifer sediminum]
MALLWEHREGDNHYQVRTHGASVRLYTNGVFHSQWNPRDPLRGSLWELLLLPVFFRDRRQIRSVLVLGVGGGAVIRLLQRFVGPELIVGVDLDPVHLEVARNYFGAGDAELVCGDARSHVAGRAGDQYDLIIDDLFGHVDGEARRTVRADGDWCRRLLGLLSPAGIMVGNFGSRREMLDSGWRATDQRASLQGNWSAELPGYENCVLAVSRAPLSRAELLARAPAAINPSSHSNRLSSHLRRLRR